MWDHLAQLYQHSVLLSDVSADNKVAVELIAFQGFRLAKQIRSISDSG